MRWARPMMGGRCDFPARGKHDIAGSEVFDIRYRFKGQDEDEANRIYPLYRLLCRESAYNHSFVYLTQDAAGYRLLSFAEPKLDYDYTDERFTTLKAPPKIVGYTAITMLNGGGFDPKTKTISMRFLWRQAGDAWSSGVWAFVEGQFILRQYDMDPTFDGNADNPASLSGQPPRYRVYP